MRKARVIGSGPNGLSAAIVLAQAGFSVDVYEAEAQPGGAVRTMELTLPGFQHDFGAAVFPMAAGSPFFRSLELGRHGLEWVHGDAPLAHPLDDGSAVMLERGLGDQERALGPDGAAWGRLVGQLAERWWEFADDGLGPPMRLPKHPWRMARFGMNALQPAASVARALKTDRARALFAGLAAHSGLPFHEPISSAPGLVLAAAAHAVGWPVPRGGAQAIPDALLAHLHRLGGRIHTGRRIMSLDEFVDPDRPVTVCDVGPRQFIALAGNRLRPAYSQLLAGYRYGPGAFKVDYALSEPIPWRAAGCRRAITVHVGGSFAEIADAEAAAHQGRCAERPFILLAQPTLFDPTRSPEGKHVVWAYCHVPNGSTEDISGRIEAQIERFAPGFRDCVLARRLSAPAELESRNANLCGGDVNGGLLDMRQFLARPSLREYRTGTPGLYLCSASTPPGGGVHGMCGYHAATAVLRDAAEQR
ncbi:MAG: NAD(P)/FAD-dependent oxidoreductase [Acidobacteriota bacterium]|nr:NAD(P)/FAD-dependent oxidoreductase [Acidobacteriota bacterium]